MKPTSGQASEAARGLRCPRCGCTDLRVKDSRKRRDRIVRVRVCRHCGTKVRGVERIEE